MVELVMVLVAMTLIAGIAIPRYASATARYQAEFAARRVAADLDLAADAARSRSASRVVTFFPSAGRYTVSPSPDPTRPTGPYEVLLGTQPFGAKIASANFGGLTRATFDAYGRPVAAGQVVIRVGTNQRIVRVDSGGRTTVE